MKATSSGKPGMPPAEPGPAFEVGSLVRARGREWVVLPGSTGRLMLLRPLGGTEEEATGILTSLEAIEQARFPLPDPEQVGDYRSGRLLRDALRLGVRWSAGPFRSFGRIAVEPRPYQLVPLLLALKLDPVRMLIADDVGIGKTIEACLIARELIDRGECRRMAVLCPPHLAEQWQRELESKFHLESDLVLAGTVRRLERDLPLGDSLFQHHPRVVVSIDYIKADRRRDDFIRHCPELVIVDEAHACAYGDVHFRSRHQRFELIRDLAADRRRHMVFVTATPHSGKEEAFRSLLAFLDPAFAELPGDLTGPGNTARRRLIAAHFVQRRRADIRRFMGEHTDFPDREETERHYKLTPEYRRLLERVLAYARETVKDDSGGQHRRRVRWWSALALLRSLASSPAAAEAALRSRSASADTISPEEADAVGRRQVLDMDDAESADALDVVPGSDPGEVEEAGTPRRRLAEMARAAETLKGDADGKLALAVREIRALIAEGFQPIVFCRFIPTAEYVADELRQRLGKQVAVEAVTGNLPPAERELRVGALGRETPRVLVCTDCLSEGINLQEHFNAVVHYDLSWNPTRHEQREGRVDRYGQPSPTVRALTLYGTDNAVDGLVLDVLLRKHKTIRTSLGISVPVPVDTNAVVEAILEGLLLRGGREAEQGTFEFARQDRERLYEEWERAGDREKRSRTMFAQEGVKVEEVARELTEVRAAVGAGVDVERFTRDAVELHGGQVSEERGHYTIDLSETPAALRESCDGRERFKARFGLPVGPDEVYLPRTHPWVAGMADFVLGAALDARTESRARRCGVIRTDDVERETTLLLLRLRYHLSERNGDLHELLAEEAQVAAFTGGGRGERSWLGGEEIDRLLKARPRGNLTAEQQAAVVRGVLARIEDLAADLDRLAETRGRSLLDAHRRVRTATRGGHRVAVEVKPELPADLLGIYVFLPRG